MPSPCSPPCGEEDEDFTIALRLIQITGASMSIAQLAELRGIIDDWITIRQGLSPRVARTGS